MQGGKGPEGLEGSQASHRQRRGVCREGVHVRRSEYLEGSKGLQRWQYIKIQLSRGRNST